MTQHLPNFYEKVDDYFKKEKKEHEKKEEETETQKTSRTNPKKKIGKKHKQKSQKMKISALQNEMDAIKMVDGLAIDVRDKKQMKREMVKLKAEFSYNR